eukprot:gene36391-biopygen4117
MLDPSARRRSEELPKGSKWFVAYRGKACGVYADYDLAKSQIFQVSGGKLRGFPDETAAVVADQLRLTLELQRHRDRVHAEGTELISVYTDGSYTKAEPPQHLPAKAGWGFIAVTQTDDRVLCQRNNFLMMDLDDIHYHGAKNKSNNTAEVTAIGEALKWIHQQPPDPAIIYEICSDSYYGIDAVDVMPGRDSSRIRNGRLIQWAYDQLALTRRAGSIVQFRKRPPVSSPRPGTPGGSHRTPPSVDRRTQQEVGASAQESPAWNKRPWSIGTARPVRPEPLATKPRDALFLPRANTWEHDSPLRQHYPNPLAQANLTHTDAASLSESGISKKLQDAATTRKSESLAATRQWFALHGSRAPGPTLAKDERGERDSQLAGEVGE